MTDSKFQKLLVEVASGAADARAMAELGRRTLDADLLVLWHRSGKFLRTSMITPINAGLGDVDMQIGEGVAGTTAARGLPFAIPDIQDDVYLLRNGIRSRHPQAMTKRNLRGAIYLPIVTPRSAGVIAMYSTTRGQYTDVDIPMVTLIAERIMLRMNIATLDERVGRLARIGYVLNEHIHDIRQSALTAAMNAETVRDDERLPSGLKKPAANSVKQLHALARQVNQSLGDVVRDAPKRRRIPLARPVSVAVESVRSEASGCNIALNTDLKSDVSVFAVEEDLSRAVLNLLRNSIRSLKQSTHRRKSISVSVYYEDKKSCVDVTDNGAGISEQHLSRIFDFGTSFSGGSGIGLSQVEAAIVYSNGDIKVESVEGHSTKFSIKFPNPLMTNREMKSK